MLLSVKRLLKNWRRSVLEEYRRFDQFKENFLHHLLAKNESYNRMFQKKYSRIYENYWIPVDRAKRFHVFNDVRTQYIYNTFYQDEKLDRVGPKEQFSCIKMLVVGCSGGILTESMAELNFNVTGIDPDPHFIVIAENHRKENKLLIGKKLNYVKATVEEFSSTHPEKFDAVVISNVLEYDIDFWKKRKFLKSCVDCCKPGGNILITTMDSSFRTFVFTVRFDTEPFWNAVNHRWYRGTNPRALQKILENLNCRVMERRGIQFGPFAVEFVPSDEIRTWYYMNAIKNLHSKTN